MCTARGEHQECRVAIARYRLHRLIEEIRRQLCLTVVVLGREDDLLAAVDVVRAGAAEYVEHPLNTRRLRTAVNRAIASTRVAHTHCR